MNEIDYDQEWEFITHELHSEKASKTNLIRRETLFGLQILLCKMEAANYLALKNFYYAEKAKLSG